MGVIYEEGIAVVVGSALIGLCVPVVSLIWLVAPNAMLTVLCVLSAFWWMMAASAASLLWTALNAGGWGSAAVIHMVLGVLLQEGARILLVAMYVRIERYLSNSCQGQGEATLKNLRLNDISLSLAAGTGWSLSHALLVFGTILAHNVPELGTSYSEACPKMPVLVLSSVSSLLFAVLDMGLMYLAFWSVRRGSVAMLGVMVALHICVSLSTLLRAGPSYCYRVIICIILAILCKSCKGKVK
ncbi:unnamed protein product [Chrysoparadoxa australica]